VSTRLDPEEALAAPLYVVALMLILIPAADFLLSVPPAEPSNIQWRFAAVGLLSGYTITPILGLALALVVSAVVKQVAVQRVLVITCFMLAVILFILSVGFMRDVIQLRASTPQEGRPAFNSAWTRAIIKHLFSAGTLAYLGWRARRMLPARSRHRDPKPVIVIRK
jgi:hypothetical protein